MDIVYQPAIRLDEPRVDFFEALARFHSTSRDTPENWFAAASELGLGAELETLAAKSALEGLSGLPEGSTVSINASPSTLLTTRFAELIGAAPLHRIIIEITERHAVTSYQALLRAIQPWRQQGLRVAVDDAGAGHSSFRHILDIRPDIIKLDMSVCRGIHQDGMRQALASALIAFSRQVGSDLVAEGVETAAELQSLRELGMLIIQGHIIARPMKLESVNMGRIRRAANGQDAARHVSLPAFGGGRGQ